MHTRVRASLAGLALLLAAAGTSRAAAVPPFTAEEMMKLRRISDPQLSPDGRWMAYSAVEVDLSANARNTDLWLAPVSGEGAPRRLTDHPRSDSRPRWSPDGQRIAFVSAREAGSQVWVLDVAGGQPRRVTSLATGAGGVLWIDDASVLVTSDVFPECNAAGAGGGALHDEACNKRRLDAAGKPDSGRLYDRLLFRHWDTWEDQRRTHLLVVPLAGGAIRDVTPGERDVPPFSLGGEDYAVSPDGREVAFVRNDDPVPATSTNAELFVVPTAGGAARKVSGSPGYDGGPVYSPDGRRIAFRAQERAGYESDRWRLKVYERATGAVRTLTEALDRQVEGYDWSADSRTLYFNAAEAGREPIFSVPAAGGTVKRVAEGTFAELQASADGRTLIATRPSLAHPPEVWRVDVRSGDARPLTHVNDAILAPFALRAAESVTYKGAAGKDVQAWIVTPPGFDPARRYPLLVLIHGGPQGAWSDAWSYRWNPQVFASAGYVVFMPNPRGSVGWGQEFVDDINADWGGRAYEDIMKGTDFAEALPYVDKGRTVAAGASYGGYMVNWIAGHSDRFRALVSHDGVFDLRSMAGSTEELWFTDWEFKGPYWENAELYERLSPSAYVKNFKTPTLVVHGELDYRVPIEQGLAMFTALQRRGVPSRLLVFPDENHWVLKPANSVRWYREVIGWLDRWSKRE